jgi:hypothetical protein
MAVRQGDWKLVAYAHEFAGEESPTPLSSTRLYNLRSDIGETNDLASGEPAKVKELQSLWDAWNATLHEPLWPQVSYTPAPAAKP